MTQETFIAMNTDGVPWSDAGRHREVKVLRRADHDDLALDALVRLPPGFVEPRHTSPGECMVMIVEGSLQVDGRVLGPGDYLYRPRNIEVGPFEYPDGAVVYESHRGSAMSGYYNGGDLG